VRSSKYEEEETGFRYDATSVVLLTECAKLFFTLIFHFGTKNPTSYGAELTHIYSQRNAGVYFAVPALLYLAYNCLSFINLNTFDPASFKVLINMRILFSAVLFQLFFSKRLPLTKWCALVLLMIACGVNQIDPSFSLSASLSSLSFVGIQAFMSSLGGVYSEFLLKKDVEVSMNVKNMYLYLFSISFNVAFIAFVNPTLLLSTDAFFHGYTTSTYVLVVLGAFCGFSTALFLRHLSVLLKEYAHSGEMFVTALLSSRLFDEPLHPRLIVSMLLVSASLTLYNRGRDVIGELLWDSESIARKKLDV